MKLAPVHRDREGVWVCRQCGAHMPDSLRIQAHLKEKRYCRATDIYFACRTCEQKEEA